MSKVCVVICATSTSVGNAAAGGHDDVCSPCCYLRPWWCIWSVLLHRAVLRSMILLWLGVVLMSVAHVITEGAGDARG